MTEDINNGDNSNEVAFHSDPVINAGLAKLEAKAAFYNLAHGVITGKFNTNFMEWKTAQSIVAADVKEVPSITEMVEWMHLDANLSELLTFKDMVSTLMTELNLAIFGHYASKNVRGTVPADTNLSEVRADLVKVLNGTLTMIEAGIIEGMTVEMVLSLPSLVAMAKEMDSTSPRRSDGTWVLPNAPKDENNAKTNAVGALRGHNTVVKFVVDGTIHEAATLAQACQALFHVDKPADIANKFDNWSAEYFAAGSEEPKKCILHDGKKIWLTKVG
jgi:hypothetical protein